MRARIAGFKIWCAKKGKTAQLKFRLFCVYSVDIIADYFFIVLFYFTKFSFDKGDIDALGHFPTELGF
jgi:hypothetical protein